MWFCVFLEGGRNASRGEWRLTPGAANNGMRRCGKTRESDDNRSSGAHCCVVNFLGEFDKKVLKTWENWFTMMNTSCYKNREEEYEFYISYATIYEATNF